VIEESNLLAGLRELVASDAHEARLLVQAGPVYMLFLQGADHDGVRVEAVASSTLPPEHKLSGERAKEMRRLGFLKKSGRRNWHKRSGSEDLELEELASESVTILERLYGAEEPAELLLVEDEMQHPNNPGLREAMREAARKRDEGSRHKLYNALINAELLIPLDPTASEDGETVDDFLVLERVDGRAIYAAFTDWGALRKWQPRGWSYRSMHGSLLFEALAGRELGPFRINPEGDLGGELYPHEVEMLAVAVQKHRRRFAN
jgi:hypothetical protein